jgi:phosphatidylinositol phospholipase C delta
MDALKMWRAGSQVVALNWQHNDRGMQLNEAMFVGSGGWVLKPARLLGFGDGMASKLEFACEIIGMSSCAS